MHYFCPLTIQLCGNTITETIGSLQKDVLKRIFLIVEDNEYAGSHISQLASMSSVAPPMDENQILVPLS